MIRFLFRLLALAALSVAVIFAVLDAARSIAASAPVLTPLKTSWLATSPETLARTQDFVTRSIDPMAWDPVAVRILELPGFAVFAGIAFLFFAIGHRRERRPLRIAA